MTDKTETTGAPERPVRVEGDVMSPPLPLGTKTEWGKIEMIGITGGERYYWMCDGHGSVSMIPAFIVERWA